MARAFVIISFVAVLALSIFTPAQWSPYAAGALIGVVCWLAFFLSDKRLGTSTTYVRLSGMITRLFNKPAVDDNEYFQDKGISVDWQMMLVFGLFLGALTSAVGSQTFSLRWVPELWQSAFGAAVIPRLLVAFVGGALVAFGARWAGGCTSGHGITGALQMSVAGWISAICFFIGGIAIAMIAYGTGGPVQ